MAFRSYVLVDMKVSARSIVLGKIHFQKKPVSGRYMCPERTCFPGWLCTKSYAFLEGTCLRKNLFFGGNMFMEEYHFRENLLPKGTCFQKTHPWPHTFESFLLIHVTGSHLRKAYLLSVLSGRTWDARASWKTYFDGWAVHETFP